MNGLQTQGQAGARSKDHLIPEIGRLVSAFQDGEPLGASVNSPAEFLVEKLQLR